MLCDITAVYQYIYNSQQSTHFNDIQSNISSSKLTMPAAHQFCQDLKWENLPNHKSTTDTNRIAL